MDRSDWKVIRLWSYRSNELIGVDEKELWTGDKEHPLRDMSEFIPQLKGPQNAYQLLVMEGEMPFKAARIVLMYMCKYSD